MLDVSNLTLVTELPQREEFSTLIVGKMIRLELV